MSLLRRLLRIKVEAVELPGGSDDAAPLSEEKAGNNSTGRILSTFLITKPTTTTDLTKSEPTLKALPTSKELIDKLEENPKNIISIIEALTKDQRNQVSKSLDQYLQDIWSADPTRLQDYKARAAFVDTLKDMISFINQSKERQTITVSNQSPYFQEYQNALLNLDAYLDKLVQKYSFHDPNFSNGAQAVKDFAKKLTLTELSVLRATYETLFVQAPENLREIWYHQFFKAEIEVRLGQHEVLLNQWDKGHFEWQDFKKSEILLKQVPEILPADHPSVLKTQEILKHMENLEGKFKQVTQDLGGTLNAIPTLKSDPQSELSTTQQKVEIIKAALTTEMRSNPYPTESNIKALEQGLKNLKQTLEQHNQALDRRTQALSEKHTLFEGKTSKKNRADEINKLGTHKKENLTAIEKINTSLENLEELRQAPKPQQNYSPSMNA